MQRLQTLGSVEVVFELMTQRRDDHLSVVDNLEQRHIAGASERDDELAQKRALADFAASEGRSFESRDTGTDGKKRLLGLQDEVEESIQVDLSLRRGGLGPS